MGANPRQYQLLPPHPRHIVYRTLRKPSRTMDTLPPSLAAEVLSTLRAHQQALRQAGIMRLSLFGSVARNEAGPDSDIDLVAEFDPAANISLLDLVRLERELGELLGREVQILPEPIRKERLRKNVDQDRIRAF
jgi:uncharacterized protein